MIKNSSILRQKKKRIDYKYYSGVDLGFFTLLDIKIDSVCTIHKYETDFILSNMKQFFRIV